MFQCEYLQLGGALVCGSTAWGWLQGGNGLSLADFPFARFCDYLGVKLTDNYSSCPDPIVFRKELIKFKNVHHLVRDLPNDPNNVENLAIVGSAIKEIGDTLPGVPVETLHHLVMNAGDEVVPVSSCPVRDKNHRERTTGICGIMSALPGIKAAGFFLSSFSFERNNSRSFLMNISFYSLITGVRHFPGDFDRPPHILTDVLFQVTSDADVWFCTGKHIEKHDMLD